MDGLKVTIPTTADVNRGGVYTDLSVDGETKRPRFTPTDAILSTNAFQSGNYNTIYDKKATYAFRGNAYGSRSVDASDTDGGERYASVDNSSYTSAPALHSESTILEVIEAHGVSLGKNFFNKESHEFNLGVEPKWVNRSNISKSEADSLDIHPDYRGVEFDFRDMGNAKAIFEQMKLFQEAIKAGNLPAEKILEYSRKLELLSQKLGVDVGQLIQNRTPLTDEQLYRSGVNAHKVLRDADGKPVVAIPNHSNDSSNKHSNGTQIEGSKYSTISLSPNLWITRKDGKIAQSPYALHRHEYGDLNLPEGEENFRNWERSPLNHHTQARFKSRSGQIELNSV